jgi:hypothetical protein
VASFPFPSKQNKKIGKKLINHTYSYLSFINNIQERRLEDEEAKSFLATKVGTTLNQITSRQLL